MTILSALSLLLIVFALATIRQREVHAAGDLYLPAFHDMVGTIPLRITPSDFDGSDWVDDEGYLLPGTPLASDGTIAGDAADETAAFVVPYAVGIADSGASADLTAAPDGDIAVATRGDVVQEHLESNLGRDLTANEVSAIESTGRFVLV